jgi:hypothetical protein
MYVIKIGEQKQDEFETRKNAVQAARELSANRHSPVRVLRDGGVERLVYNRGRLTEGAFITPERRRRVGRFS